MSIPWGSAESVDIINNKHGEQQLWLYLRVGVNLNSGMAHSPTQKPVSCKPRPLWFHDHSNIFLTLTWPTIPLHWLVRCNKALSQFELGWASWLVELWSWSCISGRTKRGGAYLVRLFKQSCLYLSKFPAVLFCCLQFQLNVQLPNTKEYE